MAAAPGLLRTFTCNFTDCAWLEVCLQMGIYAMLGVSQAVAAFFMGATFALFTYFASQRLHKVCIPLSIQIGIRLMTILAIY